MKLWITKYALTDGIVEAETDDEPDENGLMRVPKYLEYMRLGKDCHASGEAATADAIGMRDRKLASLEKQIARLKKLTFGVL